MKYGAEKLHEKLKLALACSDTVEVRSVMWKGNATSIFRI